VGCLWATGVGSCGCLGGFLVCSLRVGLEFFVLVGLGSRGFVWWASFFLFLGCFFFSIFSFAFSLVYCWCTKGRLTLLIKSVYYLSKKIIQSLLKHRPK
jgi:hypothetical protein